MIAVLLIGMLAADNSGAMADSPKADGVVVVKSQRVLSLLAHGKVIRTYKVALGGTPEGHYIINRRNPASRFYKSIHISYPNEQDRPKAHESGHSPGGDIMIHGLPNGMGALGAAHRVMDWTDGCIAVTDAEMDEIWKLVPDGTPIEIKP